MAAALVDGVAVALDRVADGVGDELGGGAITMRHVPVLELAPLGMRESRRTTEKLNVPAVVGVPATTPFALMLNPGGSVPPVTKGVTGKTADVKPRSQLTGTFATSPAAQVTVVLSTGAGSVPVRAATCMSRISWFWVSPPVAAAKPKVKVGTDCTAQRVRGGMREGERGCQRVARACQG